MIEQIRMSVPLLVKGDERVKGRLQFFPTKKDPPSTLALSLAHAKGSEELLIVCLHK